MINRWNASFSLGAGMIGVLVLQAAAGVSPAGAQQGRGWEPAPFQSQEPKEPRRPPRSEPEQRREPAPKDRKDGKSAEAAPPKPIPKSLRPPGGSAVPQSGVERTLLLRELYAHLATAADEQAGEKIATAIEHVWGSMGGDTVNLLLERAQRAVTEKKPELALRLLDRAAQLAPDFPEVFNRRAAVHFTQSNITSSIGDLRRVLALEPNHFRALDALAQVFKEIGRKKAALEVYRKLYDIHPQMQGVKSAFEELEREVGGQES